MYKKIIVPIEMGQIERGIANVARARKLLEAGGEIVLLNVVEIVVSYLAIDMPANFADLAIKDATEKLAEINADAGGAAKTEVRVGSAAREILNAAEHYGADLIIIGSHRPDFSNYLIGATADRVVRHAKCSVLVDR